MEAWVIRYPDALRPKVSETVILTQARMRLDRNGNTELLQAFWNVPENQAHPDLVSPLLTYADLMATRDGRDLETARLLYGELLEPLYRT